MLIIPFFIHHQGCPHRCLFCNQLTIAGSGRQGGGDPAGELERTIQQWLARPTRHEQVQVAFFGGSFTCLDQPLQHRLLQVVAPYLDDGRVGSVRLSTRPDCLSGSVCDYLIAMGVGTVEIGAQSMDDRVLARAGRGHTAADVERAVRQAADGGLQVGVQLMAGLPGETTRSFMDGVRRVVELAPDLVRLYPTLVLEGTGLADIYRQSTWKPLSLERAVVLVGRARELFLASGIAVVRMGLQPTADLEKELLAGPYHPAFGELVLSRDWYRKIRPLLIGSGPGKLVKLSVSGRDYSALSGLNRRNLDRLRGCAGGARLLVEADPALERGAFVSHVEECD